MKLFVLYLAPLLLQLQQNHSEALEFSTHIDDNLLSLRHLLGEILVSVRLQRCFVVITDDYYHSLYDQQFFQRSRRFSAYYYIKVQNTEDLLAPHYQTVRVLKQIRSFNCDLHLVTLLNGLQVKRFLQFVDKHRILNVGQKFVFLNDARILEIDMLYIWSNMISSIFLKRHLENRFSISSISYPNILNGVVVTKHVTKWEKGMHVNGVNMFPDKSSNLNGVDLPVVVFQHVPMVMLSADNETYRGLEVEILKALGVALNFRPRFFESADSAAERWGRSLPNGSFTGLIGQLTNRSARLAIGDLHLHNSAFIDLSWHSHECLTFLTPESLQNNAWRTLIQPFSVGMWCGVLLSLFITGTIFYTISFVHALLMRGKSSSCGFYMLIRKRKAATARMDPSNFRDARFRAYLNRLPVVPNREDLFDNFANCILLTYSMLMYVALPRMPRNWPLRVLTGWYWIYCILVTVTYRASFTAILANPAARITIDTLEDLVKSRITASAWREENKKFFDEAFDDVAQEIGFGMEIIDDVYSVTDRIVEGKYAYYDNEYFLRHLRLKGTKRREGDEVLHIMRDCVVHIPVALGLEKNSPLKPHIDKYLRRLSEGGLIAKWLKDAVVDLPAEEQTPQEALMDLRKIWSSFVALSLGYFLGICAIVAEKLHFKYIVSKHPLYDVYNPRLYYNFKRRFPNA